MRRFMLIVIAAAGLTLAGCGGGEDTVGYKLAAIDGNVGQAASYEQSIATVAQRCNVSESEAGDIVARGRSVASQRGLTLTANNIMAEIMRAVPSGGSPVRCNDVVAAIIADKVK